MKCMDCKKPMSIFEPQGMFPIYRTGSICVKCSEKLLKECKPQETPLFKLFKKEQ